MMTKFSLGAPWRARLLAPLIPLVMLTLSGCKSNLSLISTAVKTPVATATAESTPIPQVLSSGYDQFAGNCFDAANEDLALIDYATSQNYKFDMQLTISPTTGCSADVNTGANRTFLSQVGQATLVMNALDTAWVYGYAPTREAFIQSTFAKLQAHYPSVSKVTITVMYGGRVRATLSYTGHGQPVWQDYG
ncbi:MAG: hypothetical protein JWO59_852 [Chloroflexi bacterium]|jgi:hypothetical protein|nr:hypothetical protein [Chloroflexota bacterium]MDB5075838.1 hypothetical protein [Chloroflexota bacterium]